MIGMILKILSCYFGGIMALLFQTPYSDNQRILRNLSLKYIQNLTPNHAFTLAKAIHLSPLLLE